MRRSVQWLVVLAAARLMAADPAPPERMAPQLGAVTPQIVEQITQACPDQALAKPERSRRVLIFSLCEGFVHDSILVTARALQILGDKTKAWTADVSYDYGVFSAERLAAYDAIVLNNCGKLQIPTGAPRQAFLDFVNGGRGLVVLHGAVDNFGDWTEARELVGGAGAGHPWGHYKDWRFTVEEPRHPLTAMFDPAGFTAKDEQYQYDQNRTNQSNVRVLVAMDMADPDTAKDEKGQPRGFRTDGLNPVVWVRPAGRGRVFVNGFGHNQSSWWDPRLLRLSLAGLQYALGDLKVEDGLLPKVAPSHGLTARWWNNNAYGGEPALTNVVNQFNPLLNGPAAPFPACTPPLGPEDVSARFTGKLIPRVSGDYKFVSNADDYVGLWVNGVEEIPWSGHTAKDRFSVHTFSLVKDVPLDIRVDYRQDKLGYKLTLRLAHQPDGEQVDFGPTVGELLPASEVTAR